MRSDEVHDDDAHAHFRDAANALAMLYRAAKPRTSKGYQAACSDIANSLRALAGHPSCVYNHGKAYVPLELVCSIVSSTSAASGSSNPEAELRRILESFDTEPLVPRKRVREF